jgi:hypothetical protein
LRTGSTLCLSFPFGQTVLLALLILALLAGASEIILRLPSVQSHLPPPSVGSTHEQFEIKLHLLDKLVEEEGAVDCIFIGSSLTNAGINPLVFQETYKEQTGDDILCFNFGASGSGTYTQIALADILIEDYHPKLLIFEMFPLYFNSASTGASNNDIFELSWVRYHRGEFSIEGWLAEHSTAYRYSFLLGMNQKQLKRRSTLERRLGQVNGHNRRTTTMVLPLSPEQEILQADMPSALSSDGQKELEQILAFHQLPQTQVILVEMPLYLGNTQIEDYEKRSEYEQFVAQIGKHVRSAGALFWPTRLLELIPDDSHWRNVNHLNRYGATVFSQWLGRRVGCAVNKGLLADPTY